MSIVAQYETYRDRVYQLLNQFVPVQQSLDILTGISPHDVELRRRAGLDVSVPGASPTIEGLLNAVEGDDDDDDEEEEEPQDDDEEEDDDEFSNG